MLGRFRIMTDIQANDGVTFDFNGASARYVVFGFTDHRIYFVLVHNVAK